MSCHVIQFRYDTSRSSARPYGVCTTSPTSASALGRRNARQEERAPAARAPPPPPDATPAPSSSRQTCVPSARTASTVASPYLQRDGGASHTRVFWRRHSTRRTEPSTGAPPPRRVRTRSRPRRPPRASCRGAPRGPRAAPGSSARRSHVPFFTRRRPSRRRPWFLRWTGDQTTKKETAREVAAYRARAVRALVRVDRGFDRARELEGAANLTHIFTPAAPVEPRRQPLVRRGENSTRAWSSVPKMGRTAGMRSTARSNDAAGAAAAAVMTVTLRC